MSQSEDSSDPENIEWQHAEHFNPVKYLLEVGRGDETTRETRRSDEIADLTRHPEARTFDEVFKRWEYERGMQDTYPHDAKITFRTAKNKISPRPYDKIVRNGDSYFSAAVAMLVYGDADLWYLTRAEHLQYYISCLGNPSHPRYELYHRLNSAHKSLHPLSHLRLSDRIKIPNCWISHESAQQVTADLYGIFLIIFSSSFGTEAIADIRIRGSYNAPHRFLRYSGGDTYWPLVPSVKRPSEHRFPKITFDNTQGELGMANNLRRKENDGLLHPWRRPFPDIPVPDRLTPVPITILGPIQTCVLETILWVNFKKTTGDGASDDPTTIKPGSEIEVLLLATPEFNQEQPVPMVAAHPPSMATKSGADQQEHRRHVDYFQISLKDITQIALERGIDISSASTLPNREVRRERVASLVEAWEEEQESAGRKIQPVSEAVWRDIESYANARGLSSIPTGVQALRSFAKAKPGSSEHPLTRLGEMSHNGDGYIKRVLMGVEIEPVKSKEENIGMYREWIEAHII